jgi:hypothetical protein
MNNAESFTAPCSCSKSAVVFKLGKLTIEKPAMKQGTVALPKTVAPKQELKKAPEVFNPSAVTLESVTPKAK